MMQAAYSARAALLAQQKRLDVISNNIANINTDGFKAGQVSFQDLLYTQMTKPAGDQNANLRRGTGVKVSAVDYSFAQGSPVTSDNPLDISIQGEGFFAVQGKNGEIRYTRQGSFTVSNESGGRYLVTDQGYYVLNKQGTKIRLPDGDLNTLSIAADGYVSIYVPEDPSQTTANTGGTTGTGTNQTNQTNTPPPRPANMIIAIKTFPNPYGLESEGGNLYAVTAASGAAKDAPQTTELLQGYIEGSNVDIAVEMTNSIVTSRAFSFASRVITTADEMDALANNMRQ